MPLVGAFEQGVDRRRAGFFGDVDEVFDQDEFAAAALAFWRQRSTTCKKNRLGSSTSGTPGLPVPRPGAGYT